MGHTTTWLIAVLLLLAAAAGGLTVWRLLDRKADNHAWAELVTLAANDGAAFDPTMVADLPDPAQRYFLYTIEPGTPIRTAVELRMTGQLGFGGKDTPNYQAMHAHQILSPPHGLIWKLNAGTISGSDGATAETSWTRFWLFKLVPVVRAGGPDHRRSAFGRIVAEGAFWAPAALLPSKYVRWEEVDADTARAVVTFGEFQQAVDVTVTAEGQPTKVIIQRWSNENLEKVFREQPFGGYLSAFETFEGYRLPTQVEGGNLIGTPAYFPFFKANIIDVRFPIESQPQ